MLLLEAKVEEECMYDFDVVDVPFDYNCFSGSF